MRQTAALIASVVLLAPSLSTQAPVGPTAGPAVELKPTGGRGLTEVHGIKVGSVTLTERPTGCTVILVDGEGVPGGVSQRGGAPATSETDLLHPLNMVDKVNAIVLAGGSAYGLDARTGVVRYLEEHKMGWRVSTGVVPIVPSAILFDLGCRQQTRRAAQRRLRLPGAHGRERRPGHGRQRRRGRRRDGRQDGRAAAADEGRPRLCGFHAAERPRRRGDGRHQRRRRRHRSRDWHGCRRRAHGRRQVLARHPQDAAQRRSSIKSAAPRAGENTTHRRGRHQRAA